MDDVTIVIKTFERPECLRRLLTSIKEAEWQGPVSIADDSSEPYRDEILRDFGTIVTDYVNLPFDVGLSVGRNVLLRRVQTPYFLLCDDDFVFEARTDVARLRTLLKTAGLDLVGGVCYDRMPRHLGQAAAAFLRLDWWRFLLRLGVEIRRKTFYNFAPCGAGQWRLTDISYGPPLVQCDFVSNFFLARTERVLETAGGWDDAIKIGSHQDFFFRAKERGLRVGHTEEVGICHVMELPGKYRLFRSRGELMRPKMFAPATFAQRARRTLESWGNLWGRYRTRS